MTEQRYKAVQAMLADGRMVSEVASDWSVSRRTMHRWLARYEGEGLEGLGDRSHRPAHCPHQMPAEVEVMVLEMRRAHAYWGARRIAFELARKHVSPTPSESAVYRCLVRAAVIDPLTFDGWEAEDASRATVWVRRLDSLDAARERGFVAPHRG